MTVILSFFDKGTLVERVNISAVSFYAKVCKEIADWELKGDMTMIAVDEWEEAYTDKVIIRKIWTGCIKHGYISQDHDIFGLEVDKIVLK